MEALLKEVLHADKNVASREERSVGKRLSCFAINRDCNLGKSMC